jgi:AbrB family looped-hinge helix DNA binding protein
MQTTKLSTKGQIILPKASRNSRSWGPGTEFTVIETRDGILLQPTARFPKTDLAEVAGCLRSRTKLTKADQTYTAIDREVTRRHDSGRY